MPSVNEKKARELAKLSIKMEQQLFIFDGCKKMAKDASPEIKKEIEDFRTERLLDAIKKVGIEQVEEEVNDSMTTSDQEPDENIDEETLKEEDVRRPSDFGFSKYYK